LGRFKTILTLADFSIETEDKILNLSYCIYVNGKMAKKRGVVSIKEIAGQET